MTVRSDRPEVPSEKKSNRFVGALRGHRREANRGEKAIAARLKAWPLTSEAVAFCDLKLEVRGENHCNSARRAN